MLKFAINEQDITPVNHMYICGYTVNKKKPLRRGKNTGALDKLTCVTALMEINGNKLVFITLEFTFLIKSFTDKIRDDISIKFSIPKSNIIVSATHTHSGPYVFLPHYVSSEYKQTILEEKYLSRVTDKVMLSMNEVIENLEPVNAYYSLSYIDGYYGNRNVNGGVYDNRFHVIRFKNNTNQLVGSIANISCHPTILKENSLKFSGDLLGNIRKKLSNEWNAPMLLTNGASGDVSSRYFTKENTYETVDSYGTGIANQVLSNKRESLMRMEEFSVRKVRLNREYAIKKDKNLAGLNLIDDPLVSNFLKGEIRRKLEFSSVSFDLEGFIYSLGPLNLITIPGECVTSLANKIRVHSKAEVTWFVCYANDFWHYFVPEEEYGKYFESHISYFPKGLADEFGNLIINELGE